MSSANPVPTTIVLEAIGSRIFLIRDTQVMLDRDLAEFYEVKPIRLREQVKRNADRFPSDFMFQLTDAEVDAMVSQSAIPSRQHLGGALPYAFTEQGVAALSGVLRSDRAVEVGIQIARAFVAMRRLLITHSRVFQRLEAVEHKQLETDKKLEIVLEALETGSEKSLRQGIFYDGQIFDAYAFVADLIRSAKKSLVLIDNYLDDSVLTLLCKRQPEVTATLYTRKLTKVFQLDLDKHNAQYPPVTVKTMTGFHDRFLLIDDQELYHLGASLKDLGKQCFAFSQMDDFVEELKVKIKDITP